MNAYAWAVVIPTDESVQNAVQSGKALRKTKTSGAVVAVISSAISKSSMTTLQDVFDLVVVKDIAVLATGMRLTKDSNKEENALLISALNMTMFSKIVVLKPGTMVKKQMDALFDTDKTVVEDVAGNWIVAVIAPNKKKYAHAVKQLKGNEVLTALYSGQWKTVRDKRIFHLPDCTTPSVRKEIGDSSNGTIEDTSGWTAIVGMACRFPNANSLQEYWEVLTSKENACSFPPQHRRNLVDVDTELKANFLKCPLDQFDANFFGFSPSEATFTDPQARLLLEVSWEAFEDAAINPEKLKGTQTGVFYGSWLQEYKDAMNAAGSPADEDFIRKYIGNSFGCSAAKLSFFYGFSGPNVSTESGCSSSMVAVDLAVKSLQNRECPTALVAGANILLHLNMKQKVLWAEDGKSRTFDADANGYARSEGVAVMILKRYSDAIRDGDKVHAIIRGTGISQEGLSKSFGTPTVESECAAMQGALKNAKVEPWEVDYVEAHATGTAVGDPIEANAIVKVYSTNDVIRERPLLIGSGKTHIGHTESCSGLAGIFKVVLALKNDLIPPHLNLNKMNPQVNFDPIPGEIPIDAVEWPKRIGGKPRIAGVSSFGITGTDVHVILQEGLPDRLTKTNRINEYSAPPLHLLTISAKSEAALEEYTTSYTNYLDSATDPVEDITFTGNVRRPHHTYRKATLGFSNLELKQNLIDGMFHHNKARNPKVCFTFPGRIGAMDLEPAKILYQTAPVFRKAMDLCDKLFQHAAGKSLLPLLTNKEEDTMAKGSTWYALIIAVQYSLVQLWASWGVQPDCVMGHCIGEISAAVVSGALPIADVFKMVKCMDYFLQVGKEQPALMMAIQASSEHVEKLMSLFSDNNNQITSSWIEVASRNAFDQTVVAGDVESMKKFKEFVSNSNLHCKLLTMDFCAHSRAVEDACQQSLPSFESVSHKEMKIPYVTSVTGKIVQTKELNGQFWYSVFRNAVNFTDACRTTTSRGLADVYIEMGLEGALSRITQENLVKLEVAGSDRAVCLPSLYKMKGDKCWVGLLSSLAHLYTLGGNIDWEGFYGFQTDLYQRVKLPSYPFQRKSFWYERRNGTNEEGKENPTGPMFALQGEKMHSLLGLKIETCVEDPIVFQNYIQAEDTGTKYIYDHIIGTEVIYPGAAYLEQMLSGVKAAEPNIVSIVMNGFTVTRPLKLDGKEGKIVQCVVDKTSQTSNVFAYHNDNKAWKKHANCAYVVSQSNELPTYNLEDYEAIKERCNGRIASTDQFYELASQVGLKFGKDFRSLKQVFQSENGSECLLRVCLPEDSTHNANDYLCHPILIDAMIQGFMFHTKPELKKLFVPVKVGQFTITVDSFKLAKGDWFVYCTTDPVTGLSNTVYLINQDGVIAAVMNNPELVMTSVESVLTAAGCTASKRESEDPTVDTVNLDVFDVVWHRSKFHQISTSIKASLSSEENWKQQTQEVARFLESRNAFSPEEVQLDKDMDGLCDLYVLKAVHDLGWSPEKGLEDLFKDPVERWGILPSLSLAFKHFITYHSHPDYIAALDYQSILAKIDKTLEDLKDYPALKTVQSCGAQLAGILQGTVNAHKILFGSSAESPINLAEHYYKTSRFSSIKDTVTAIYPIIQSEILQGKRFANNTIKILEVGGGTGSFAQQTVKFYKENEPGVKFEYTFTDISTGFLGKAKEAFAGEPFIFKTFNIEMDPLKQGFSPEYYDIVVAIDVVHATKNVKKSLTNLELVTKSGGWILLAETEKPVKEVDICFGILDGYWLYEDGIRQDHCTLNGEQWLDLLKENGFARCQGKYLSCNSNMSIITAQKEKLRTDTRCEKPRGKWIIFSIDAHMNDSSALETFTSQMNHCQRHLELVVLHNSDNLRDQLNYCLEKYEDSLEGIIFWLSGMGDINTPPNSRSILEPILYVGKHLMGKKGKLLLRLHVVTEGCQYTVTGGDSATYLHENVSVAQAWGFLRNLRIELPGILSKSIDLETGLNAHEKCDILMSEIWLDDKETEVAFRGGERFVRRGLHRDSTLAKTDASIQECGKFYAIELPVSKVITDVRFTGMDQPEELQPGEILVEVRSVSLNFKDVLAVMKPSTDFEHLTSIGLDFSGVVTAAGPEANKFRIGQAVFGCGWDEGAMKSHVVTSQDSMVPLPDQMTHNEGATLPAVWITAWYCMVEVAKLSKGQTALVHAASGGVGLMAIQIAKLLGIKIIGTAGTEKKRRFLRNLGVEHVFNSRDTEFGQKIMEVTDGRGVDMVLNCLTAPGFKEATLEVCKDGGHFVEISKLAIWSPQEVSGRRPRVNYTIVDATEIEKTLLMSILEKLTELIGHGSIKPLPYTCFTANQVKDALTYLQKAKQIGKVIITMPQYEEKGDIHSIQSYMFNPRSSYLITGGKGAIGMSVAKWMVTQGAKYIILVGRSPASAEVKVEISKLEAEHNAVVVCKEFDITELSECRQLFQEVANLPPIRGIHHCAGALLDKLLSQHTDWSAYEEVLHPKVKGAWNLHQMSKNLLLEHFVLYSSAASTFGNIGQSNYVSANCYMDCLSEMRVAMGLPSLSINFGQWNLGLAKDFSVDWLHPFTATEGVKTLETLMSEKNPPCVVTGLFDFHGMLRMTPYYGDTFLSTLSLDDASFFGRDVSKSASARKKKTEKKALMLDQYRSLEDDAERLSLVKDFVIRVLCDTLGTKPDEINDHDQHFSEMGMDSLMSIEFANKINSEMDSGSFLDLEECGTVNKMTEVLNETMEKLV